jgi:hypothetical protein
MRGRCPFVIGWIPFGNEHDVSGSISWWWQRFDETTLFLLVTKISIVRVDDSMLDLARPTQPGLCSGKYM